MTDTPLFIPAKTEFLYLPRYAALLRDKFLPEYVEQSIRLSQDAQLPLLKYFKDLSQEEWRALVFKSASEFLNAIADNQTEAFAAQSVERWLSNQLPQIEQDEVVAEDITMVNHVRKKL